MKVCNKKFGVGVNWNTHKKLTYCKCKKIWVDGCEDFTPLDTELSNGVNVRIGGKEGDRKVITK